jgi:small subunit ribosomal protein S17
MRTKKGTVVSAKGMKTAVIIVHTYKTHPKYFKRYRVSKKFHAHDEENACKEGDLVTIAETRPISKLKHWKVTKIHETK